jgi:hypothetical protein
MYEVYTLFNLSYFFLTIIAIIRQIITGREPFHELQNDIQILRTKVVSGNTMASKPESFVGLELSDDIWNIMEGCWNSEPEKRPALKEIIKNLRELTPTKLTRKRMSRQEQKGLTTPQLRRAVDFPYERTRIRPVLTMKDVLVLGKYSPSLR